MAELFSPHRQEILDSLIYQGQRNDCGPFTTATVINALCNLNLDALQLSDEMDKLVWRGIVPVVRRIPNNATFPWGMVDVFKMYGLRARWRPFSNPEYLKKALPQGKILMLILGTWQPKLSAHVMTLVAWDEEKGWGFANTQHNHHNISWFSDGKTIRQWKAMGNILIEVDNA